MSATEDRRYYTVRFCPVPDEKPVESDRFVTRERAEEYAENIENVLGATTFVKTRRR